MSKIRSRTKSLLDLLSFCLVLTHYTSHTHSLNDNGLSSGCFGICGRVYEHVWMLGWVCGCIVWVYSRSTHTHHQLNHNQHTQQHTHSRPIHICLTHHTTPLYVGLSASACCLTFEGMYDCGGWMSDGLLTWLWVLTFTTHTNHTSHNTTLMYEHHTYHPTSQHTLLHTHTLRWWVCVDGLMCVRERKRESVLSGWVLYEEKSTTTHKYTSPLSTSHSHTHTYLTTHIHIHTHRSRKKVWVSG